MRRYSNRSPFHAVADINIVPLVDLVFVLLIIFMLATPLLEQTTEIQVPSTKSGAPNDAQSPRVIAIDQQGRIFLDSQMTDLEKLKESLLRLAAANPSVSILVRTDKRSSFENFAKVLDVIKQANIQRMGVITVSEEKGAR